MGLKAIIAKPFARFCVSRLRSQTKNPIQVQEKVLQSLLRDAKHTIFGKEHHFELITDYEKFKKHVPIRDYEGLIPYIEKIKKGESDVLWKGKPLYLCKTSGTTSGTKYIPISKESIHNHIDSARNALLCYISETGKADFVNGKMIFLQGNPQLKNTAGISTGRLSGIVAHHVPKYLQSNRMPSYEINCIDDWEAKVEAIAKETLNKNMTLISGIPPWVQMYFDKLKEISGKEKIVDIFPNFSLFVYGGVNFEPYRLKFEQTIGKKIDSIEVYPASEGFIAFQDSQKDEGLLLVINSGIFYEFIPADEFFNENPTRISLKDVELNKNYVLILNTNAGLWGYNIGDTVKFVSLHPYRILVTGRIKHFTSAFGEHVIAEEVEYALKTALAKEHAEVIEFHVAPQITDTKGKLPYHEWMIEFAEEPKNIKSFSALLDEAMQKKNVYYYDLIVGNVLQPLKITPLHRGAFINYMKQQGKLGGQNKVPRLANDRKIADELFKFAKPE